MQTELAIRYIYFHMRLGLYLYLVFITWEFGAMTVESIRNLDYLLHTIDAKNIWSHRVSPPSSSSVAKGKKRNKIPRMVKRYECKKKSTYLRRNAPFREPRRIARTCCNRGCLNGISNDFIRNQRRIYQQSYKDINYAISSLMKVTIGISGRRRIIYEIHSLGQVCKLAFKKCFALSNKKLVVILNKRKDDSPMLDQDLRGRHKNNCRTMPAAARETVISFIKSFNPEPSHYHRNRTNRKYFSSHYTMRALWRRFNKNHPRFKATRLKSENISQPISFSCFGNIFCKYLSDEYSFRLPRTDTCQTCDQLVKQQNDLERTLQNPGLSDISNLDIEAKLLTVQDKLSKHLNESELRYSCFDYDINVLAREQI